MNNCPCQFLEKLVVILTNKTVPRTLYVTFCSSAHDFISAVQTRLLLPTFPPLEGWVRGTLKVTQQPIEGERV